ncbi:hypothetical protein ACFVR2_22860 [Gottfriedia sp. NPDC057991]|uniref:hypothetical protein n=1 Tax=Gottfriedia sp. NPDC057991 TaxID=3346298 RepID=UPI0036D99ED2
MIKKVKPLLLAGVLVFSFASSTFAASYSPKWQLRPDTIGDTGAAQVDLPGTDSAVTVIVWQQGINAGKKAYTYWQIRHKSTGLIEGAKPLDGDYDGSFVFSGLDHPGGIYIVEWESFTSNDTEGYYQLATNSSGASFARIE